MSEYQYHEFCSISKPLSSETRQLMASLSSRACINIHSAVYIYNYGDFGGDEKKLLLDHFDVYFYIANWGTVQLMFKYSAEDIDINELKPYCIEDVITCEKQGKKIIIDILIDKEDGFGWIDGEGRLPELLPLYDEIKHNQYQFLSLVSAIHHQLTDNQRALKDFLVRHKLSEAQTAFLNNVEAN